MMVCMDGFILTHAVEAVDVPDQAQVDAFLPAFQPRQVLDPDDPVSIGAMVGPEAFTEVQYLAHAQAAAGADVLPRLADEFARASAHVAAVSVAPLPPRGRGDGGGRARLGARHAQGHDRRAARRRACASASWASPAFRPFPVDAVRAALARRAPGRGVEKAFAVGVGGIVARTCGWRCPG